MKFLLAIGCLLIPLVNTLEYSESKVLEALKAAAAPGVKDILKTAGDLIFGEDAFTNPTSGEPLPKPTKLKTPSLEEATYYVHFAAAAYCEGPALSDWTCVECKLVDPAVKMHKVFTNETRGTQAYIVLDAPKQEIILVFRGTHNVPNALDDCNWELVPSPFNNGIKLHHGFHLAAMSLYPDILSTLTELLKENPGFRVVVTGHSLGGAMSALTYYHLNHDLSGNDFALFTYGQPRSGDQAFADYINLQSIPLARVTNKADLAPHLMPSTLGYLHHVTEFWTQEDGTTRVCSNEVYEDPTCSNSEPKDKLNTEDHNLYLGTPILMVCI